MQANMKFENVATDLTIADSVTNKIPRKKKALSGETLIFVGVATAIFGSLGMKMGAVNLIKTIMNTSYDLLMNTVLYIMAIAVIAGALAALLTEFGVVAAINKILAPGIP